MTKSSTHTTLTRRERQIMDVLYRRTRATAADVMAELPGEPNYSTVRTQLRVLEDKGHVRHEEEGGRYVYAPALVAAIVSPVLGLVTPSWHVPLDAIARPQLIGAVAPPAPARRPAQPAADTDRREEAVSRSMAGAAAVVSTAWLAGAGAGVLFLLIGPNPLTWIPSPPRR